MCARFLRHLLLLYNGRVHRAISGCTVLGEVHMTTTLFHNHEISRNQIIKKNPYNKSPYSQHHVALHTFSPVNSNPSRSYRQTFPSAGTWM